MRKKIFINNLSVIFMITFVSVNAFAASAKSLAQFVDLREAPFRLPHERYPTASGLRAYLVPAARNCRNTPGVVKSAGHEQVDFLFKTRSTTPGKVEPKTQTGPSLTFGSNIEPVKARYVVVTNARVREQPSIRSRQIESLKKGQKVWVAGRTKVKGKTWFLVDLPHGQQGFVYENLIKAPKTQTGPSLTFGSNIEPVKARYVVVTNARVREQPSIRSRQIESLKKGQKVWVAGRTKVKGKTWFLVDLPHGQQGFVYENLIKAPKTQTGPSLTFGSERERKGSEEDRKQIDTANLTHSPKAKEIGRDGHFIAYANGTVMDAKSGLMWAAKYSGRDVTWQEAMEYCENYLGGGYKDWRMPTLDELAGLYDRDKSYQAKQRSYTVHLTELIELTACCPWASETRGSDAAYFNFIYGYRVLTLKSYSRGYRALPVRGGN